MVSTFMSLPQTFFVVIPAGEFLWRGPAISGPVLAPVRVLSGLSSYFYKVGQAIMLCGHFKASDKVTSSNPILVLLFPKKSLTSLPVPQTPSTCLLHKPGTVRWIFPGCRLLEVQSSKDHWTRREVRRQNCLFSCLPGHLVITRVTRLPRHRPPQILQALLSVKVTTIPLVENFLNGTHA